MSPTLQSLGLGNLGIKDKLALIEELWESVIAEDPAMALTDAQRAELDRRIADYEANPDDVVPWEEIKASRAERLKK